MKSYKTEAAHPEGNEREEKKQMDFTIKFIDACFTKQAGGRRLWVYKNGVYFADYAENIAFEVAADIRGVVVDPETGEILS